MMMRRATRQPLFLFHAYPLLERSRFPPEIRFLDEDEGDVDAPSSKTKASAKPPSKQPPRGQPDSSKDKDSNTAAGKKRRASPAVDDDDGSPTEDEAPPPKKRAPAVQAPKRAPVPRGHPTKKAKKAVGASDED